MGAGFRLRLGQEGIAGGLQSVRTVVGIATDRPQTGKHGHSSDIVYLHMPDWDPTENAKLDQIQADLGYFRNTRWPA